MFSEVAFVAFNALLNVSNHYNALRMIFAIFNSNASQTDFAAYWGRSDNSRCQFSFKKYIKNNTYLIRPLNASLNPTGAK